ncbi:MAG: hypothetical protein JXR07_11950 [Reichenbachiella sp.]
MDDDTKIEIIIIESLRPEDLKTGAALHNETIKYLKFKFPDLLSNFHEVNNKKEFFNVFSRLYKRVTSTNILPNIHLETHGSLEGIQLCSGETVLWKELFKMTRKINVAIKNSLILQLALCEGGSLIGKFEPDERAPFMAVIATFKKLDQREILKAYQKFYESLFNKMGLLKSLELMNAEVKSQEQVFHVFKSEHLFDAMLDENRDPEHFNRMVKEQAIKVKASNSNFQNVSFEITKMKTRNRIIKIHEEAKLGRDYFLMKDL